MGFLSDLLLGKEQELEVQRHPTLTPEQDALLKQILSTFTQQGGANFSPEAFGGDLSVDLGDRELMSLQALEERVLAQNADPLGQEANNALLELLKNRGASGADFNDFFQTNIQQPLLENFNQVIRPQIGRSFGGSSFFSSERQQADAAASEDLIDALTGARSKLAFETQESAADRLLTAIGLQDRSQNNRTNELLQSLDAFGVERENKIGNIEREFTEFARQQDAQSTRIAQILSALGVQGFENIGQVKPGRSGLIEDFLREAVRGAGSAVSGKIP